MPFVIVRHHRYLHVGLFVVGEAGRVGRSHGLRACVAAATKDVYRRVLVVTYSSREDMATGFFCHQDVQTPYVGSQLLRSVFGRELLVSACLIGLVRVGRRGAVRVRLHVPFPTGIGTVHVMHLRAQQ